MLLKYKDDHDSIKKFNDVKINDFSILTGINGAGKTQLLKAIEVGDIVVSDIPTSDISYFNFSNFKMNSETPISLNQIRDEKRSLWAVFFTRTNPAPLIHAFSSHKSQFSKEQLELIKNIVFEKNKPLLSLNLLDLENNQELFQCLKNYRNGIDSIKQNQHSDPRIVELAYGYIGFLDEISKEEFFDMIKINPSVENFLTQQISKIFLNFNDRILNEFLSLLMTQGQKPSDESMVDATNKILKKYGGKYPWTFINELLGSFSDFKYQITLPPKPSLIDITGNDNVTYTALLHHAKSKLTISFDKLSSGEQILLSLAIVLFGSIEKYNFPKLILLDEIDSSLHPSMIKNLLISLQDTFTNNGIKIIMVTHSATTVVYAPDDSIYLVDSTSEQLIVNTDKQNALDKLTQGYMILHDGNIIFDSINNYDLTIFSEGNNVEYIQTAIKIHCNDLYDKINVWKGIQDKSGVGQLETLYHLLHNVNLKKKILFVFDPEAELKVKTNKDKLIFVTNLKKVGNTFTDRGVESILPDEAFNGFTVDTKNNLTGTLTSKFPSQHKTPLCKQLTSTCTPEFFKNFKPLTDYICEILQ